MLDNPLSTLKNLYSTEASEWILLITRIINSMNLFPQNPPLFQEIILPNKPQKWEDLP